MTFGRCLNLPWQGGFWLVGVEHNVLSSCREIKDKEQRSKVQQSMVLCQCYWISLHEYISKQLDLTTI